MWHEVEARMEKGRPKGRESVKQCKARLRRVATRIPEGIIRKAVENMKARAQAIFEAKGKDIPRD